MSLINLMLLLLFLLINFTPPPSFAKLSCNYSEKPLIHGSDGCVTSNGNGAMNQSKFAHARAAGGGGGRSTGVGGGSGGGSHPSPQIGGGAVIPIYAAGSGAAVKNKNHHSTASICSCRYQKDRLLVVAATALTSLLLHNLFV